MNRTININLEEKISEFPEELKEIALEMINNLNKSNVSEITVEDMVERKINQLAVKGE